MKPSLLWKNKEKKYVYKKSKKEKERVNSVMEKNNKIRHKIWVKKKEQTSQLRKNVS